MQRFTPEFHGGVLAVGLSGLLCLWTSGDACGQVIAWGRNPFGETNVPPNLSNVVSIAAGGWNSMALQNDGTFARWGILSSSPVPGDATNIVAAAAGSSHGLLLRADGKVIALGGVPAVPGDWTNMIGIAAGAAHRLAVRSDGTVAAHGDYGYGEANVPAGLKQVVSVAGGEYHSLALRADGTVAAWGWNGYGQTNVPAGLSNVAALAAGYSYNLALKSDGTLAAWGDSTNFPAGLTNVLAIASGLDHFLALKSDGVVVGWGDNTYGETDVPGGLSNVVAVAGGYGHSVLRMGGGPPQMVQPPLGATVPAGFTHVLKANASGTLPLHYQWRFNGTNLPGATRSALLLTNLQYSAQGSYSVAVSNVHDLTVSSNADLMVVPMILTSHPTSQTVFGGDNVTLSVEAQGVDLIYAWRTNNTALPGQTNSSLTISNVTVGHMGSYSVIVSNSYGVLESSNVQLTVVPLALTTQPLDQTVYEAADVSFSVAAERHGPFSYQWRFNGDDLPDAINATLLLPTVATNQAGTYAVLVTNPYGSLESSNAQLTVVLPDITSHPESLTVYGGDDAAFGVGATGAQLAYQWQFNGTNLPGATNTSLTTAMVTTNHAGIYSALVSNPYRTLTSSNAALTVIPLSITTQPTSRSAYVGDSTTFSVSAFKHGPFTYRWRFGGVDMADKTNSSFTLTGLVTSNAGPYSVVVANPYGSLESAPATLEVLDSKPIITSQPADRGSYLGGNAAFLVVANGTKPLSYQWRRNDTDIPDANAASLSLSNLLAEHAGAYSVLVSNAVGVTLSSNANLVFLNVRTWGTTNSFGLGTLPLDLTNVIAVAGGNSHSLALKSNGRVTAWGFNFRGQTNVPASATNIIAIAAGGDSSLALRSDGTVVAWGNLSTVPGGLSNVVAVATGESHHMALKSNGSVVAWGSGAVTNVPASATNVVAIGAGDYFGAALKSDRTVLVWGSAPPTAGMTNVVAISAGDFPLLALKADGRVIAAGVTAPPASLSNAVAVAAGRYHALALKVDGTVTNWGIGIPATPADLSNVATLASGPGHALAVLGSGPQPVEIPFSNARWISNSFTLTLPSQIGRLYLLEFKDSLNETIWRALPMSSGTGSSLTLTNSPATNSTRFYRVRQW